MRDFIITGVEYEENGETFYLRSKSDFISINVNSEKSQDYLFQCVNEKGAKIKGIKYNGRNFYYGYKIVYQNESFTILEFVLEDNLLLRVYDKNKEDSFLIPLKDIQHEPIGLIFEYLALYEGYKEMEYMTRQSKYLSKELEGGKRIIIEQNNEFYPISFKCHCYYYQIERMINQADLIADWLNNRFSIEDIENDLINRIL